MTDSVEIRRGVYHDSVTLMQVSQRVRTADGVRDAMAELALRPDQSAS